MACPETRVGSGWESRFAPNHLGHFVLTAGVLPNLLQFRWDRSTVGVPTVSVRHVSSRNRRRIRSRRSNRSIRIGIRTSRGLGLKAAGTRWAVAGNLPLFERRFQHEKKWDEINHATQSHGLEPGSKR